MRLKTYLELRKISPAAFGEMVGASEPGVVKWMRGERVPRRETMRKIMDVTDGAVGPSDFLEGPGGPDAHATLTAARA